MKNIIHITAGDRRWAPTGEDLQAICRCFQEAVYADGDTAVVATRSGVAAQVLSVSEGTEVRIVSAHIGHEASEDIARAVADHPSDSQVQTKSQEEQ